MPLEYEIDICRPMLREWCPPMRSCLRVVRQAYGSVILSGGAFFPFQPLPMADNKILPTF